jgi:AcrR family transcriptional regulator
MPVPSGRTSVRADQWRERIVDGAPELFAGTACDEASIADVCSQARIEPGALNRYFEDERAVLGACVAGDIAVLPTCGLIGSAHHQPVPR